MTRAMKWTAGFALLVAATMPANAALVYSNGSINGTQDAIGISTGDFGFGLTSSAVSNSFSSSSATTLTDARVGLWVRSGNVPTSVEWSIGTSTFGSDVSAGTSLLGNNITGFGGLGLFDVYESSFSLTGAVGVGTYWLTLQNAGSTTSDVVYWDFNFGPSTAFAMETISNTTFPLDVSQSFQLFDGRTPGTAQDVPVLPTSSSNGAFVFTNVASGLWFDPPLVSGFHYEMTTPGSFFTGISGFPTGFTNPFTVSTGATILGQFTPGQTLTFAGDGVTSFDVTGISPLADAASPNAFPLQLQFSTPTASFTMQGIESRAAVPEPASLTLWSLGALGCAIAGYRRRKLAA